MNWEDIKRDIGGLQDELTEIRRDLHRHPELGFEEVRTRGVVRAWLEKHGYEPKNAAGTGLWTDLKPGDGSGAIALRADMDALPMTESTDLPYRSVNEGCAHKCGHDGHTATLMGVAAVLARRRDEIPGNVRLIFQPAEEGVEGGGARLMVDEGVLEGVREVYGQHNWPGWPMGELRVAAGPVMAQVHSFDIAVTGIGGHGSQPQICRDPIVAACHLVTALQTVVSRGLGSVGGGVVSVCSMHAGTTHNVIPGSAELQGTIRSFNRATSDRILERMDEIVSGTSATFGVDVDLHVDEGFPVLVNDAGCVDVVERIGREVLGPDSVSSTDLPIAGGEDFAYYAQERPSAFFFLGAGIEGENTPTCHHPDFDFNDDLIPVGMEIFLRIVEDRLGGGS